MTEQDGSADGEVGEEADRLQELIERHRPPAGPVTEPWALGVGDLLAEHPKVPGSLGRLVRKANRFGGVAISPQAIEFDGDEVDWADVTEVRTQNLVEYLLSDSIDQQLETIPLPPFPGRQRLLEALGRAVLMLLLATAKQKLERDDDLTVPAEVAYSGGMLRRSKELQPGFLAALLLADPAVCDCVLATARAKGIPVRDDSEQWTNAEDRAAAIRAKLSALESKLDRLRGR